jgi:hypothetical protein
MSYSFLFAYSGVQHILCCVFVMFVFVLCLGYPTYVASYSGLSIFNCPFDLFERLISTVLNDYVYI